MFHQLPTYTAPLPAAPPAPAPVIPPPNLPAPAPAPAQLAPVAAAPAPYPPHPAAAPAPPPAAPPALDLARIPLDQHPAAVEYDDFLSRLTFNSKDLINTLSRVAQENMHNSDAIVSVLQQRIVSAPPSAKLPLLYLVDSIVKNVGAPYVQAFAPNLFHMFTTAYAHTTPQVRMSMHRLLNTWPHIFGLDVVTAMRRRAADMDSAPPPIPPHPMHTRPAPYQPHGLRLPQHLRMPQTIQPPPLQHLTPQPPASSQIPPYASQIRPPAQVAPLAPSIRPPPSAPVNLSLASSAPAPLSNPPSRPALRSAAPAASPAAAAAAAAQFTQVQTMMHDISRKASMGVAPSNHQLFTINRLITTLLSTSSTSVDRETLLRFQRQLRDLPARASAVPPPPPAAAAAPSAPANPFPAPFPAANALPVPASQALSSLLSNPPPGLLAPSQHLPNVIRNNSIPPSANHAPLSTIAVPRHPAAATPLQHQPPLHRAPVSTVLKFADLKRVSHPAAVRSLYADLPHLSKSDGMRFATTEQLREHLDWLFKKNRSKRARERGLAVGGSSRCWFESVDGILSEDKAPGQNADKGQASGNTEHTANGSEGGTAAKGTGLGSAILAQGASERCQACQEELESFWSDDQQSWMLKDAIRTEDNEVYHKTCVETLGTPHVSTDGFAEVDGEGAEEEPHVATPVKKEEAKVATGVRANANMNAVPANAMPGTGGVEVSTKAEHAAAKLEQKAKKAEPIAVKTEQSEVLARPAPSDSAKAEGGVTSKKRTRETRTPDSGVSDAPEAAENCGDLESPSKRLKKDTNV